MKLLICGDVHMCKSSSLIVRRGTKHSKRLENCINTINWVEKTAIQYNCDAVVYLGDFFDKPVLDEQVLTALPDIVWQNIPKYFIVGNHDTADRIVVCSSVAVLKNAIEENCFSAAAARHIINMPETVTVGNTDLVFLPYISEADRQPFKSYLNDNSNKKIVFSHNDLAGINYGVAVSQIGFDVKEIKNNCDMFINGHLHNGEWIVKNKVRNLGNITGQNFGEDATRYNHKVMIIDTDTLAFEDIENPYAFNFYKLEINDRSDFNKLDTLKNNAVISVKCKDTLVEDLKTKIAETSTIAESKVTPYKDPLSDESTEIISLDFKVDHLKKLQECCEEKIGKSAVLDAELAEICK